MKQPLQVVVLALFTAGAGLSLAPLATPPAQSTEASAQANRGVALLEQFRFSEAIEAFEAVVGLEPDGAAGHINLGIAYFNERDFDKALASFVRARELDASSPYAHYNLGLVYKLQGETEEALAAFSRVLPIDPVDSMTHYYIGTLYANLGRLEEAEATLRRTIELQPNNESAHFSLGNILIRQGRREEGRAELLVFQDLKRNFPGEASAGLQYTELGKYAVAVEMVQNPDELEVVVAVALHVVLRGNSDTAAPLTAVPSASYTKPAKIWLAILSPSHT